MSGTAASVIRMANQIARNFATMAVADHIAMFWDPRMKEAAFSLLVEPDNVFSALARQALERLSENENIEHQMRATTFNAVDESGRSDAG